MNCDTDMDGRVREDEWSSCLGCQGEFGVSCGYSSIQGDYITLRHACFDIASLFEIIIHICTL